MKKSIYSSNIQSGAFWNELVTGKRQKLFLLKSQGSAAQGAIRVRALRTFPIPQTPVMHHHHHHTGASLSLHTLPWAWAATGSTNPRLVVSHKAAQ